MTEGFLQPKSKFKKERLQKYKRKISSSPPTKGHPKRCPFRLRERWVFTRCKAFRLARVTQFYLQQTFSIFLENCYSVTSFLSVPYKSRLLRQKILQKRIHFLQYFFIQVADLVYHRRKAYIISPQASISSPKVYSSATWWYPALWADDIPQQVADDIQGSRLDLSTKVW